MNNLKTLRDKKGVSQQAVADYLGITRQAYSNYEAGKRQADYETLLKLGEFFEVSINELLEKEIPPTLTTKDERDIAKDLDILMNKLSSGESLMFDGDPMSPEAIESIRAAMKLGLEAAKLKNKERFTPKKHRKEIG